MYEAYFGLKVPAFRVLPNANTFFWDLDHAAALATLETGLERHSPITLLTGPVGAGKTTIIEFFMASKPSEHFTIGMIADLPERRFELYQLILYEFGEEVFETSEVFLRKALIEFLVEEFAEGRRVILIVDEAQNAPDADLERLRILTNHSVEGKPLLSLVLVGQPQLRDRLKEPQNLQIVQRIAADYDLGALSSSSTGEYIQHRLSLAGGSRDLFQTGALREIHMISRGIPRVINILCDLCLAKAHQRGLSSVDEAIVRAVRLDSENKGVLAAITGPDSEADWDDGVAEMAPPRRVETPPVETWGAGTLPGNGPLLQGAPLECADDARPRVDAQMPDPTLSGALIEPVYPTPSLRTAEAAMPAPARDPLEATTPRFLAPRPERIPDDTEVPRGKPVRDRRSAIADPDSSGPSEPPRPGAEPPERSLWHPRAVRGSVSALRRGVQSTGSHRMLGIADETLNGVLATALVAVAFLAEPSINLSGDLPEIASAPQGSDGMPRPVTGDLHLPPTEIVPNMGSASYALSMVVREAAPGQPGRPVPKVRDWPAPPTVPPIVQAAMIAEVPTQAEAVGHSVAGADAPVEEPVVAGPVTVMAPLTRMHEAAIADIGIRAARGLVGLGVGTGLVTGRSQDGRPSSRLGSAVGSDAGPVAGSDTAGTVPAEKIAPAISKQFVPRPPGTGTN